MMIHLQTQNDQRGSLTGCLRAYSCMHQQLSKGMHKPTPDPQIWEQQNDHKWDAWSSRNQGSTETHITISVSQV